MTTPDPSREADSWQPISTAPKDGTWMMLWRTPEEKGSPMQSEPLIFGRWYEEYESFVWPEDPSDLFTPWGLAAANKAVESDDGFGLYESNHFTHWQPLPAAPKQEGST